MKSCGFEKTRMSFSSCNLVILMLISGVNSFVVIRSTTPSGGGDVDRYSSPTCDWIGCLFGRGFTRCSSTKHASCCFCECSYNKPNYVISTRMCEANNKIEEDCQFHVASNGDDQPLLVKEMTKKGHVEFWTPDVCTTIKVTSWSYRLTGERWIVGLPNRFKVQSVVGADHIWRLRWDKGLDAKYAGLILKFDFTCQNGPGCLLMKSKGNYTISTPGSSSQLPPLEPGDVLVDTTGGKTGPTLSGASLETNGKTKNQFETAADTQQEVEGRHSGVVVAGVTLSLAAGIVLVFATLLLKMKKRQRETQTKAPGPRQNAPNVSYEEPIHSTSQSETTLCGATFHNAFYSSDCVLSISPQRTATIDNNPSKLGPLPPLPATEEGIYEEPIIKRNVAYQDLDKETKETETVDTATSGEQQAPPVYNILEPPNTSDGEYDDNIAEYRKSDA